MTPATHAIEPQTETIPRPIATAPTYYGVCVFGGILMLPVVVLKNYGDFQECFHVTSKSKKDVGISKIVFMRFFLVI